MFRRDQDDRDTDGEPDTFPETPDILQTFASLLTRFEPRIPGLQVGVLGSMSPTGEIIDRQKGVAVSYSPKRIRAEVRIWVSERRAKLITRTTDETGIRTEIVDRVSLSLRHPARFAGHVMPSTEAVATSLLALMRRRATEVLVTTRDLENAANGRLALPRRTAPDGAGVQRDHVLDAPPAAPAPQAEAAAESAPVEASRGGTSREPAFAQNPRARRAR